MISKEALSCVDFMREPFIIVQTNEFFVQPPLLRLRSLLLHNDFDSRPRLVREAKAVWSSSCSSELWCSSHNENPPRRQRYKSPPSMPPCSRLPSSPPRPQTIKSVAQVAPIQPPHPVQTLRALSRQRVTFLTVHMLTVHNKP